jgi:membrane-associated phospholipid phosphatase
MKKLFLIFLLWNNLPAQVIDTVKTDLAASGKTILKTITAPSRMDQEDFWRTTLVVGGIGTTMLFDHSFRSTFQKNHSKFGDQLFQIQDYYAEPKISAGLVLGLYGTGLFFDKPKWRETGILLAGAQLLNANLTAIFKSAFGRDRPFLEQGNHQFGFFRTSYDRTSFPSGHTSNAFAFTTVLAHQIDWMPATIFLYSCAGAVGLARIYYDQHWFSDVVGGAVLGTMSAKWVIRFYEQTKRSKHPLSVFWYGNTIQLAIAW